MQKSIINYMRSSCVCDSDQNEVEPVSEAVQLQLNLFSLYLRSVQENAPIAYAKRRGQNRGALRAPLPSTLPCALPYYYLSSGYTTAKHPVTMVAN